MLDIVPTVTDITPILTDLSDIILLMHDFNAQQVATNTFLSIIVGSIFAAAFVSFMFMRR